MLLHFWTISSVGWTILSTEGLSWVGVISCLCCTVALAVRFAAVSLRGCDINRKWNPSDLALHWTSLRQSLSPPSKEILEPEDVGEPLEDAVVAGHEVLLVLGAAKGEVFLFSARCLLLVSWFVGNKPWREVVDAGVVLTHLEEPQGPHVDAGVIKGLHALPDLKFKIFEKFWLNGSIRIELLSQGTK